MIRSQGQIDLVNQARGELTHFVDSCLVKEMVPPWPKKNYFGEIDSLIAKKFIIQDLILGPDYFVLET
jgi:hypothetical protein